MPHAQAKNPSEGERCAAGQVFDRDAFADDDDRTLMISALSGMPAWLLHHGNLRL